MQKEVRFRIVTFLGCESIHDLDSLKILLQKFLARLNIDLDISLTHT